jgi:branched-chain amino acid transport system substrate-binding protein
VRVTELVEQVSAAPALKQRILGTAPGARQSNRFASFAATFSARFKQTPGNLAEFAYDAAYLLSYAAIVTHKRAPTGSELAGALKGLSCKDTGVQEVVASGASITESFSHAMTKPCIDFSGASGPLDFNNDTGEAPSDIALWCVAAEGFKPLELSYYDAAGRKLATPPNVTALPPWKEVNEICP